MSCLLTVTLHIADVRLTCLINITYLLTYFNNINNNERAIKEQLEKRSGVTNGDSRIQVQLE